MSTKSNDNRSPTGAVRGVAFVIERRILERRGAAARFGERDRAADGAAPWRGRRDPALRAGAPRASRRVPAAPRARDHAAVPRPRRYRAETLEAGMRLDRRSLPPRGSAKGPGALRLPDLRWRDGGLHGACLSGAGAARRAVHGVCGDRVSGWRRRGVVAGAGTIDRA